MEYRQSKWFIVSMLTAMCLIKVVSSSLVSRSLMSVASMPDIASFPYTVYLLDCSTYVSSITNNCAYLCSASLGSDNLVTGTSACVTSNSVSFEFDGASANYESFLLLSSTTDSDESIRYRLMNGNCIYVAICTGTPCTSGSNLQAIGRVYMDAVTGVSSKSHYCSTCVAKRPIYTITAAGQRGGISLYAGLSYLSATLTTPASSAFLRPSGIILNVLSFDRPIGTSSIESLNGFDSLRERSIFQTTMRAACRATTTTSTSLISSFLPAQYLAKVQCADPVSGSSVASGCVRDPYIAFTGASNNQQDLYFSQAGTVALCTCASVTVTQACSDPAYWIFAGTLLVAGPVGTQIWTIPVSTVFRLEVLGWGLGIGGNDYLRIIPSNIGCTDNNNNPESIFFKTGCPNCSSSTALPIDIPATSLISMDDPSIPKINEIRVYSDFSILFFDSDITEFLENGDRIVLNPSDLVVDGDERVSWSLLSQARAFIVAGIGRFADERAGCYAGAATCDNAITGHVVTLRDDGASLTVTAGLDEYESVKFGVAVGGANWQRHSRVTTSESLKAVVSQSNSKVCWGRRNAAGTILYYLEAGRINFVDPPAMYAAYLVPVTLLAGVAQPMTLTISPSYLRAATYSATTTVTVRFKFSNLDKLEIGAVSGLDPGAALAPLSQPEIRSAAVCGELFTDLSTNDENGFPNPSTCWYSSEYSDAGVRKRFVELEIEPGILGICSNSGINAACYYHFAFHAKLGTTYSALSEVVRVETFVEPYVLIESMPVLAEYASVVLSGSDLLVSSSLSFLAADDTATAFSVDTANPDVVEASGTVIQFGYTRDNEQIGGVQAGHVLRLTLSPQLQWNITAAACSATAGAVALDCAVESQPGGRPRNNVIKLTIPSGSPTVASLSLAGPTIEYPQVFRITIPGLNWASSGFWPTRMAMELYGSDLRTALKSFTMSQNFLTSLPTISSTGRLVRSGDTGDGPRMFIGETDNTVTVELKLATTVVGPEGALSVLLPEGYRCAAAGWVQTGTPNQCSLILEAGTMMPSGSWLGFDFLLANTPLPLFRDDFANTWQVQLTGPEYVRDWTPFNNNLAVISPLVFLIIQPSSFEPNQANLLFIVFAVSLRLDPGDQILVLAPDAVFYACDEVGLFFNDAALVLLQEGDITCSTVTGGSARLTVNRIIDAGSLLGFSLSAVNGAVPASDPWYLYTLTSEEFPLEGGSSSLPRVCTAGLSSELVISSLAPYASSQVPATVSISDIPAGTTVRITFPVGFTKDTPSVGLANVFELLDGPTAWTDLIRVPSVEPSASRYGVYLEVWDATDCIAGALLALPPIQMITDLSVTSQSPIFGVATNKLRIAFRLTTAMSGTDEFVHVVGDEISAQFTYNPLASFLVDGSSLPSDVWIEILSTPGEGPLEFKLFAPAWLANTDYWVQLSVGNPDSAMLAAGVYSVSSSLDAASSVAGFDIIDQLTACGLGATADNRPRVPNTIELYWAAPAAVAGTTAISIVTPPMLSLREDCTADVAVAAGWTVVDCRASQILHPTFPGAVDIVLAGTEVAGTEIRIALSLLSNPPIQPQSSLDIWSLVVDGEFGSGALPSFSLDQFEFFSVAFVATTLSSVHPVNITFAPRHSLQVTDTGPLHIRNDEIGSLYGTLDYDANSGFRLSAPSGFEWSSAGGEFDEFRNLATWQKFDSSQVYMNKTGSDLLMVFFAEVSLDADVTYSFVTNLVFPSAQVVDQSWFIGSFDPEAPVDELTIETSVVLDTLIPTFTMTNLQYARDIEVVATLEFALPADWLVGESVTLASPFGFVLQDADFACIAPSDSTAYTFSCPQSDTLEITNVGASTVTAATLVTLSISVLNPHSMSTDVSELFWTLRHTSGSTQYSAKRLSWRVWPEIMAPSMVITGALFAAESVTNVTFSFTPASEANFLQLNISEPLSFNFSRAISLDYEVIRTFTNKDCWNCIVLNGLSLSPNEPTSFELINVILGKVGGATAFSITTFYIPPDLVIANPFVVPSTIRDQIEDAPGSFLAGKLTWNASAIDTGIAALPYASLPLNPRIGIEAVLRFAYNVTLSGLSLGDVDQAVHLRFELSSPGLDYTVLPQWGNFSISPALGVLSSVPAIAENGCGIVAEYDTVLGDGVLNNVSKWYTVSVPVVPLTFVNSSVWLLNIYANNTLLNGNDALTITPSNVSSVSVNSLSNAFAVTLTSTTGDNGRSPASPFTQISVQLRVKGPLPWGTKELLLMAPSAFTFLAVNTPCADASLWCGYLNGTSQIRIAPTVLANEGSFDHGILPFSLSMQVETPTTVAGSEGEWILVATADGAMLGWGGAPAILVHPMPNVEVIYGGIASVFREQLILNFEVPKTLTVNSLELIPPAGFKLYCSSYTVAFISCTRASTLILGLLLNVTADGGYNYTYLPKGVYSVPLLIDIPLLAPLHNTFDLIARDVFGVNTDGSYEMPGSPIQDSQTLDIRSPTVSVTSAGLVTLSFTMGHATTAVDAVTISFPTEYYQSMSSSSLVGCINRRFPRNPRGFVDISSTQSVTFLVDDTNTSLLDPSTGKPLLLNKIPANQTMVFTFPIILPASTPTDFNYWTLSFCPDRALITECVDGSEALAQLVVYADPVPT